MGTEEYPGNAGMKDQVLVLKWVKEYISHFGGDPNKVTLMGHSAGGYAIALHMISPLSQNYFHQAILMSGAFAPQIKFSDNQIYLAKRQALLLGCEIKSNDDVINCLKSADPLKMVENMYAMFEYGRDNPIILWSPVVEKDFEQNERFLIEEPRKSWENGKFNNISTIIGITTDELMWSAVGEKCDLSIENKRENINMHFPLQN